MVHSVPGGLDMLLYLKRHLFDNLQLCISSKEAVIITNEFRTSKLHSLSFQELTDIKITDVGTEEIMKDIETYKDTTTKERSRDWQRQYV